MKVRAPIYAVSFLTCPGAQLNLPDQVPEDRYFMLGNNRAFSVNAHTKAIGTVY